MESINRVLYIIVFFISFSTASCQTPIRYWSFDGTNYAIDKTGKFILDTIRYKANIKLVEGVKDNAANLSENGNSILVTNALREIKDQLTISFFFKGQSFKFQSFPKPDFLIQLGYPYLIFNTSTSLNGKAVDNSWRIDLKGTGEKSFDYYTDGKWHQLIFIVDLKSGFKQIFVDGKSSPEFYRKIIKGGVLQISSSDGFRQTEAIDELSFYKVPLSTSKILNDYKVFAKSSELHVNLGSNVDNKSVIENSSYNPLDFAPGYPLYNVQAIDQLKSFPDPRYAPHKKFSRNFPWMDITYLHRELNVKGGKGFGESNPEKAVEMAKELYNRWNYYFEIPVLRNDKVLLDKTYSNNNSVPGALVDYAKRNPDLKTSSIIMQVQGKPVHAGFNLSTPFVTSQKLDAKYYLKDQKGNPIKQKGKFWLSPLAPLDIIYNDAKTTSFYLKKVQQYLGRPIDIINENGEYFGHIRNENLLESDPDVKRDFNKKDLNIFDYNGWFQNKLDTAYKNEILRNLDWTDTRFTFYNVAAIQPEYWPSYSFRRTSNYVIGNNHYSTPNFYPARPENWRTNAGPYNGYGIIADGRKREIELGDKFFAPFVSAGWSFEEENIRPAQWLALLKSMMMLGAEYFYVGYFNVTAKKGWPDGKGPFDPRGYIYQAAMPSYVQAIASRIYPFLENGVLLNPQDKLPSKIYSYRFKASKENHLVMVRKLGNDYLIYGSIQPVSNKAGQVKDVESTLIDLEGKKIKFDVRRQGSVYVYNEKDKSLIQYDGWHQYEHPSYWSKDYRIEAELADETEGDIKIETASTIQSPLDFTNSNTTVILPEETNLKFYVRNVHDFKGLTLKVRKRTKGKSSIMIQVGKNSITKIIDTEDYTLVQLTKFEVEKIFSTTSDNLSIITIEGEIQLDYLVMVEN